ncbi:hypothetical protein ABK040_010799 [Willaertia magna]
MYRNLFFLNASKQRRLNLIRLLLVVVTVVLFSSIILCLDSKPISGNVESSIVVSRSDDCFLSINERIEIIFSSGDLNSYVKKIPKSTLTTKYTTINSVNVNAVNKTYNKTLTVDSVKYEENSDYILITANFKGLTLSVNSIILFTFKYKILGPLGFVNENDKKKALVLWPQLFEIPMNTSTVIYEYDQTLLTNSSSMAFISLTSDSKKSVTYKHVNTTIKATASGLTAGELIQIGFSFENVLYSNCYIPYYLMERSSIGIIIGSCLAVFVIFFTIVAFVQIIRTVKKKFFDVEKGQPIHD